MATNNFLPFCPTDTGTNLPTQGDYAVDADRTIGNQPGVASSKLNNKAIRQSTFIASQVAQYISDKLNGNVLDDGNAAALLAQINSALAPNDSYGVENLTLASAVGASALTISVKTQAAVNPSATDIIYVGMRSATLTSGIYNRRSISAALSMVLSSGSTLGQTSAQPSYIWVYLIDNAGVLELAVSHSFYPENALVTTTAEGGAGGADSATLIYSTTARASVPIRCIGYILNTQATAGTWASAGTQIQLLPSDIVKQPTFTRLTSGTGTYYPPAGCKRIEVLCIGGGAAGGSCATASTNGGAGGGGGGGATCFKNILNPSSAFTYGIGAAGVPGAAGDNPGGAGGDTTFTDGTVSMTAGGGAGGGGSPAVPAGPVFAGFGAGGGTASGGDDNIPGGPGDVGVVLAPTGQAVGGAGGYSTMGVGAVVKQGSGAGNSGGGYGGGGGGGCQVNNNGTKQGGPGTIGIIIIKESY